MEKAIRVGVYAAALACFSYFVFYARRALAFPYSVDYGEGPLIDQARSLARFENIYLAPPATHYPFRVANYPPLYPSLIAALGFVLGPSYLVVRALSILAVALCAFLIGSIVHASKGSATASMIGAGLFLASPYVAYWSPFARVDFVALALALGALFVATSRPQQRSTPIFCIGLAFCAAMTRQSYVFSVPIALTATFASQSRRAAVTFAIGFALTCVAAFVLLEAATHGAFFFNVVTANENGFDFPNLRTMLADLLETSMPLMGLALWQSQKRSATPAADRLMRVYFACSVIGALLVGKIGASVNYFLELVASASILGALAFARLARSEQPWSALAVLLIVAGWTLGIDVDRDDALDRKFRMQEDAARLTKILRAERGPILADEKMSFLVETGHPIVLQPFELSQLAREGRWDPSPVLADLRAQRFGLILMDDGPDVPAFVVRDRWTSDMLSAVKEAYEPTETLAGATLYRPKKSATR
jgi:hypothetical protein